MGPNRSLWQVTLRQRWLLLPLMGCLLSATSQAQQSNPAPAPDSSAAAASAPAPTPQAAADQPMETIHLTVGHSLLIHTSSRVKRLLTGNPAVIETVLTSPKELVITAKTTGGSSLMVWEESGASRMLDISADLDVGPLRSALEHSFPNSEVQINAEGEKITLVGTAPNAAAADQIAKMSANYGKDVVNGLQVAAAPHLKQILLKVRFAEADRSKLSAFGINLFSTGAANTIGTVSTQQFGAISGSNTSQGGNTGGPPSVLSQFNLSDLLNIFLFRPDINLGATIKAMQEKQVLQILAEPNLMAIDGQPAHFLAGGEFPYPVVQGGTGGAVGSITIVFKPYGVKLEFVGTIGKDNTIRLKVTPEVSSLDYTNAVTIQGFILPALQTRRAETEIELKDGQTFGIAGLLDQRTQVQLSKVPGIGDVPILGELFKSRQVNRTNSELIVMVTPTIVDPVAGPTPGSEPNVNMPVRNLTPDDFDKGLPLRSKPAESKGPDSN